MLIVLFVCGVLVLGVSQYVAVVVAFPVFCMPSASGVILETSNPAANHIYMTCACTLNVVGRSCYVVLVVLVRSQGVYGPSATKWPGAKFDPKFLPCVLEFGNDSGILNGSTINAEHEDVLKFATAFVVGNLWLAKVG